MKKICDEIMDWTGWFFVEAGVRMHNVSFYEWAWGSDKEDYHWYMRPWGWIASLLWNVGNYFYGFALRDRIRRRK